MGKVLRKAVILFVLLFSALYAGADEIKFSASVDKNTVALNEYLAYSLTVSGNVSDLPEPKIPDLPDFDIYGSGRIQNVSLVNNKRSGTVTYKYTLAPKKTGKFVMPPATVTYGGQRYETGSIDIEVTEAKKIQSAHVSQPARQDSRAANQNVTNPSSGNVFVKAVTDKKEVYVNEKLIYKFSFYTNIDLVSNPEYAAPDFAGFWNDSSQPKNHYETIDGSKYFVQEIETSLFPLESGKITINPAKVKIAVMDFSSSGNVNDFFGMFINMGQHKEKVLETDAVSVNVKALPLENRPADFKGAVGSFKIAASVDKTEVHTNEPVTLTVNVTGSGNMKSVNEIDFNFGRDFKVYDTIVSNVSSNAKEFKIVFVPLLPGEKNIPSAKLSFFDPAKKDYSFAQTQPVKIKVEGTPVVNAQEMVSGSEIRQMSSEISYNKKIDNLKAYSGYFVLNKYFYMLFAPFVLFFVFAALFRFHAGMVNKDPVLKLKKQSASKARKCIANAENKTGEKERHEFYESLYDAFIASIEVKTGIRSDNLSVAEISCNLEKSDTDAETIKKAADVFQLLNFYRFASVKSDEQSMKDLLNKVKEILNGLRK